MERNGSDKICTLTLAVAEARVTLAFWGYKSQDPFSLYVGLKFFSLFLLLTRDPDYLTEENTPN